VNRTHRVTTGSPGTQCALDRFDEAERYAAEARRVAAEDDLISQVLGRAAQATVLASRNELADAERLVRQALEMFADAEAPLNQGDVWMTLAQILLLADRTAEAEQAARQALALYERKGNVPATASTRAFIEAAR
jgi:tetratricopeptide (TPR) repeat protein